MTRYLWVIADGMMGSAAIAHAISPMARGTTVCGRRIKASWRELRGGIETLAGVARECVSCGKMKDASTMYGARRG